MDLLLKRLCLLPVRSRQWQENSPERLLAWQLAEEEGNSHFKISFWVFPVFPDPPSTNILRPCPSTLAMPRAGGADSPRIREKREHVTSPSPRPDRSLVLSLCPSGKTQEPSSLKASLGGEKLEPDDCSSPKPSLPLLCSTSKDN